MKNRGLLRRAARYFALFAAIGIYAQSAFANFFPRGTELVDSRLVRGRFWGWTVEKTARRLRIKPGTPRVGLHPDWYLEDALVRLWKVESPGYSEFEYVSVSSGAWFLTHAGRLVGYVVRVPVEDWEMYEVPVRKRFGSPKKIHFKVMPPEGVRALEKYIHLYLWERRKTQFIFLKATEEDTEFVWVDEVNSAIGRVKIMQKLGDENVPLYLGAFDIAKIRTLRGPDAPPVYFVPLTSD